MSAIGRFLKYSIYGKRSWYIAHCPLYGRCPLFGVSAKRGSTVVQKAAESTPEFSLFFFLLFLLYFVPILVCEIIGRAERAHLVDLSARFFGIYRPYVVVSMRMRYMCAFLFRRVSVYTMNTVGKERESERERRARESVHRRRLCDQESARLQRPPRKGRPARRRVRDRAI